MRQLARRRRIVSAVEIDVGVRLDFLYASRPDRGGDAARNRLIGNAKTSLLQQTHGRQRIECVLKLEAAGQARRQIDATSPTRFP